MTRIAILASGAAALAVALPALAQRNFDDVEVTAEQVAPGLAVLFGAGGNVAVSYGEDGTIMIDDQFAPLSDKISIAIKQLGATPVEFLINTHWHGDHTGGNENFGKAGATIFAHHNVRVRMSTEQRRGDRVTPPSPKDALPVVTFEQGIRFHHNGDTIDVVSTGGGHTDGDSVVVWREKNVVHMGDLYFKIPGFPFVDVDSGGNVYNLMRTLDLAIGMIDGETKVIPGHGPMSNTAELIAYRAMIGEAVKRVEALHRDGKTLEQAVASKPLDDFNRGEGFIGPDAFVTAIWRSIEEN